MRLKVRVLNPGPASAPEEVSVEAEDHESVEALKVKLERKLRLNSSDTPQKLLFKGKTLQDGHSLGHYQLVDGSKLHLMLKRVTLNPEPSASSPQPIATTPTGPKAGLSLDEALLQALRPHFRTEEATQKVISYFQEDFHERLTAMSLDDIERICRGLNTGAPMSF